MGTAGIGQMPVGGNGKPDVSQPQGNILGAELAQAAEVPQNLGVLPSPGIGAAVKGIFVAFMQVSSA